MYQDMVPIVRSYATILVTHRSNGTGFSVPQAVERSVGDRTLCRTSQLRPQSGNRLPVARHGKLFRARNLFRCVNQQGQPQALAACRSPFPELLTHRLSFWSVAKGNPEAAVSFQIS
jgi:hypothetical protein